MYEELKVDGRDPNSLAASVVLVPMAPGRGAEFCRLPFLNRERKRPALLF